MKKMVLVFCLSMGVSVLFGPSSFAATNTLLKCSNEDESLSVEVLESGSVAIKHQVQGSVFAYIFSGVSIDRGGDVIIEAGRYWDPKMITLNLRNKKRNSIEIYLAHRGSDRSLVRLGLGNYSPSGSLEDVDFNFVNEVNDGLKLPVTSQFTSEQCILN